jgi:hypothetical protein
LASNKEKPGKENRNPRNSSINIYISQMVGFFQLTILQQQQQTTNNNNNNNNNNTRKGDLPTYF